MEGARATCVAQYYCGRVPNQVQRNYLFQVSYSQAINIVNGVFLALALTKELGAGDGTRTHDFLLGNPTPSSLSLSTDVY